MKVIQLTDEQRKELDDLFEQAYKAAFDGKPGMIVGQIFNDGVRCGFISNETAHKVIDLLEDDGHKRDRTPVGSAYYGDRR